MSDHDAISAYIAHQRRRGLTPRTQQRTRAHLRLASHELPNGLLQADEQQLDDFIERHSRVARTRYKWLSTLTVFFRWAIDHGLADANPAAGMERPKLPKGLPRPIATNDLELVMFAAEPRMQSWLALMAYDGLRCQEVAYIHREDVLDTNEPAWLRVRAGKGDKQRVVPLHPFVAISLRALPMPRAGRLWSVSPEYVSATTNEFLREQGVDATAHQLRHWFGTHVYRASRDLLLTQKLLGHESPTTTTVYTLLEPLDAVPVVTALDIAKMRHPTAIDPTLTPPADTPTT